MPPLPPAAPLVHARDRDARRTVPAGGAGAGDRRTGANWSVWPVPVALDQRAAAAPADLRRAGTRAERRLAGRAQPGRALLAARPSPPAASARPACRAAANRGRRAGRSAPPPRPGPACRPNIASSSVGKPAIRSAPNTRSGPQPPQPLGDSDHVGPQVPPLHPLEHQVVAGLHGEVQMRHQPRLLGHQPLKLGVDLGRVDRGEPQPRAAPARRPGGRRSIAPRLGWPGRSLP